MAVDIREEIVAFLPRLRRFAYSLTGNLVDADDLVQEACLRALDRAHQWQNGTRIDSWMFRIAQNLWIDKARATKVRNDARFTMHLDAELDAAAHNPAEDRLALQTVSDGIAGLPTDQQVVIALVCVDGLSYREAADAVGVPIGTVMSRLARARQTLHKKLHGDEDA